MSRTVSAIDAAVWFEVNQAGRWRYATNDPAAGRQTWVSKWSTHEISLVDGAAFLWALGDGKAPTLLGGFLDATEDDLEALVWASGANE